MLGFACEVIDCFTIKSHYNILIRYTHKLRNSQVMVKLDIHMFDNTFRIYIKTEI